MTIRDSTPEDIPVMMQLFEKARGIMRSDGNMTQWCGGYPSRDLLMGDIARGVSHIVEENGVAVATFAFIEGVEPTYLRIEGGSWLDDSSPYGTIHRLASVPEVHGIAEACFAWCRKRCPNVRIDTHRDNGIMLHIIRKAGFSYCGIIFLADGSERLAFQSVESGRQGIPQE